MANKRIEISLFGKGRLDTGIKKVEAFRDELPRKCEQIVSELASKGIQVANIASMGNSLGEYVYFYKKIEAPTKVGCQALMIGQNTQRVFGEGVSHKEISPILMLEYGSGLLAQGHPSKIFAGVPVGRGTFPNQTHANDPNGWYYMDLTGKWHHSYGIAPTAPMQKAYDEMQTHIKEVAEGILMR